MHRAVAAITAVLAVTAVALAAPAAHATPKDPRLQQVRSFAFGLGDQGTRGDLVQRYAGYDLIVIDAEVARKAQIARLRAAGTIVLGYLDVGAIETYRPWYRQAKRYRLNHWDDWAEWYANANAPGYRRLIVKTLAPRFLRKGFDGLFLDNLDMVTVHPRQARGIRLITRGLARLVHRRGGFLFAQNGEEAVGPLLPYLDGWNREDVTRTYDFDRKRYVPVAPADHRAALAALRRVAGKGLLVTSADYTQAGDTQGEQESIAASCSAGAIPFVSDIALDRMPATPPRCPAR